MRLLNKNSIIILAISFVLITTLTIDIQASNPDLEIPINLTYSEELILSPGHTVKVMLVDQSASEQEDTIIASQEWRPEDQFPLETTLNPASTLIEVNENYMLVAVIKSENQMPVLKGTMKIPGYHLIIGSQVDLTVKQPVEKFHVFKTENAEDNYLAMNFFGEVAQFIYKGQSHILPQLISASGARYGNNEIVAWNKGEELMINYQEDEFPAFHLEFDSIDPETFTFTARGQEPAWQLEVTEEELILDFDYAMNQLTIDRDYVRVEREEDKIIYSVMSSFFDLEIIVINEGHFDIMSGELYLYTVELNSNGYSQNGGAIRVIRRDI